MEQTQKPSTGLLDKLKLELESLSKHFKLNDEELTKTVKAQRESFAKLLKQFEAYSSKIEQKGKEKLQEVKQTSEYLLDLLEADFDLSYTEYSDKPHDIYIALEKLEKKLKNYYQEIGRETDKRRAELEAELNIGIDRLKSELSAQMAHYETLQKKGEEEVKNWREEKLAEIQALKVKIETHMHEAGDKVEKFTGEISEAYDHLKAAFLKLK